MCHVKEIIPYDVVQDFDLMDGWIRGIIKVHMAGI